MMTLMQIKVQSPPFLHLLLRLHGGSEECDICSFPGEFRCSECNDQITCKECCMRIHKHPKKAQHKPHKIDQNITSSSPIASKVNSMSQGDIANWDDR